MENIVGIFSRGWEFFWSFWPKNVWILISLAAVTETLTVIAFRLGGNRGWIAVVGYLLGFFTLALYAEGQKYSDSSLAYFAWIIASTSLIGLSGFLFFREQFSWAWMLGFGFAIVGILLMQSVVARS